MVYCDKVKEEENSAIYKYGYGPSNKPGTVRIYNNLSYEIIEPASEKNPGDMWLRKMMVIHADDIKNGEFKDIMDYEA